MNSNNQTDSFPSKNDNNRWQRNGEEPSTSNVSSTNEENRATSRPNISQRFDSRTNQNYRDNNSSEFRGSQRNNSNWQQSNPDENGFSNKGYRNRNNNQSNNSNKNLSYQNQNNQDNNLFNTNHETRYNDKRYNDQRYNDKRYNVTRPHKPRYYDNNYYNDNKNIDNIQGDRKSNANFTVNNKSGKYYQRNEANVSHHCRTNEYNPRNHQEKGNMLVKQEKKERDKENTELNQREKLIEQLSHSEYECMICVSNVYKDAPIWSCNNCYHVFHIKCINQWAVTCSNKTETDGAKRNFRCPGCQTEYNINDDEKEMFSYRCFCDKEKNPIFKRGTIPHSCGNTCGKSNKTSEKCPHLCFLPCHPGPCSACEAIISRSCSCGKSKLSTKCSASPQHLQCGKVCDKLLNCRIHKCTNLCHAGDCQPCSVTHQQTCGCERGVERTVYCGSEEFYSNFSCEEICGKDLTCGNHKCDQICHSGKCKACARSIETVKYCWCGKQEIVCLLGENRKSCLEMIPSCCDKCNRPNKTCNHFCQDICHEGDCSPCNQTQLRSCQCGKSLQTEVKCSDLENEQILCKRVCNKKMLCRRHCCTKKCCVNNVHICEQKCNRKLNCQIHLCEESCGHIGLCRPCSNVSFDELFCECGKSKTLPPIPCNQPPPQCQEVCSREHECEHPVRHKCHSEIDCPPCVELTSKYCPGNHFLYDNIPCFRPVATCGRRCSRPFSKCEHSCNKMCHVGECQTESDVCVQPCGKLLKNCNHACQIPCHSGDCESFNVTCVENMTISCACKLRFVTVKCSDIAHRIKSDTIQAHLNFLPIWNVIISKSDDQFILNCDNSCQKEISLAKDIQTFIVPISYSVMKKYYGEYFNEFKKNNLALVVSIENVFSDLCRSGQGKHQFTELTIEQAKFIDRFSFSYNLTSKSVYNFQLNRANVTVETKKGKSFIPKQRLSDNVQKNKLFYI